MERFDEMEKSFTQISIGKNSNYARILSSALMRAMSGNSELTPEMLDMEEMSGK